MEDRDGEELRDTTFKAGACWQLHSPSSVDNYEFVDDFPIHVWVLITPSLLDKSLDNQEVAPLTPPMALPTSLLVLLSVGCSISSIKVHDAMLLFIAHAPQPIRTQFKRLQLFVMRLKDSSQSSRIIWWDSLSFSSTNKKQGQGEGGKEKRGWM